MSLVSFAARPDPSFEKWKASLDNNKPYFFSIANEQAVDERLESVLKLPYEHFVERTDIANYVTVKNSDSVPSEISLSITTGSCYNSKLAHIFIRSLGKRFGLNGQRNDEIITCLHEALTNAMLHGNIQVKSNFHNVSELYEYQSIIKERLGMETYRSRMINLAAWNYKNHLEIAVSDEGKGFELTPNIINDQFPRGRGLMYINTLADRVNLAEDKRTLFMAFDH